MANDFHKAHCVDHYRYACKECHKPPARDAPVEDREEWAERTALDDLFDALGVVHGQRQKAAESLNDFVEMRINRTHRYEPDEDDEDET